MLRERQSSQPLDQRLIAIAPFDVLDPALALWRQGFVDVLAANLDGAGAFRTVSPSLILRRWTGPSDRALAARVARGAGAAISIFGRLETIGADSVRCTVWIDNAGSGERLGELALRENSDRMDRLGDSLSIGILRELGFSGVAGSTRLSSLGSRSLPAIKLYLQGEQLFRRASFDSARPIYERAIAADSTFGLAMNRLASVLSWQGVAYDAEATRLMLTASRYVSGLSPRDSMQLTADALWARLLMFEADSAWWTKGQVLLRTLRDMNMRSPGDFAVWNLLGESYFHLGGALGASWVAARDAFDRAIAIDSAFGPAWVHPIGIALGTDSIAAARRYADGLYKRRARESREDWVSVVKDLLGGSLADPVQLERRLTALPLEGIFEVWAATSKWSDSAEIAIKVARTFSAARPSGRSAFNDPQLRGGFLLQSLVERGHFSEALRSRSSDLEAELPYLAAIGVVPAESATRVFEDWVRTGNPNAHLALEWFASRGDDQTISRYRERARRRAQSTDGAERHFAAYEIRAAEAYLSLAQRDSARAITALLALPDSLCPTCHAHRLTLGRSC
jgi:serine/threonine-protein kinase